MVLQCRSQKGRQRSKYRPTELRANEEEYQEGRRRGPCAGPRELVRSFPFPEESIRMTVEA